MGKQVLITFTHGLGDAVQFTVVLKHLHQLRPDWTIDVQSLRGKHSCFHGLCRRSYTQDESPAGPYDLRYDLGWFENYNYYKDRPNTKITNCLQEVFGITWMPTLARYEINVREEIAAEVRQKLDSLLPPGTPVKNGRYRAVVLHYQGNTSPEKKNLSDQQATSLARWLKSKNIPLILLDWDGRSPLPDMGLAIATPPGPDDLWGSFGSGDAERIAAVISSCAAFVGIDSGPGKVSSATETPSFHCWFNHHPIQFHDPAANTKHLIPSDHHLVPPAHDAQVREWFHQHYRYEIYRPGALVHALATNLAEVFQIPVDYNQLADTPLTAKGYTRQYYDEHKAAGLDYLGHGDWQRRYGRWLTEVFGWKQKNLLDLGCACGSITRGFGEAGTYVAGADCSETMIRLARDKWPDMDPILHTVDAANLHCFGDQSFDAIHTAQVAEHWKPKLVPFILEEMNRILRPGGLVFSCHDTTETFARQGRRIENEDPTHICIEPMSWWHERYREAGFEICTEEYLEALQNHPISYLGQYDWDFLVARKPPVTDPTTSSLASEGS